MSSGVPTAGESAGTDTLSDVLRAVRVTGAVFFLTEATMPWAAEAPTAETLTPAVMPGAQHLISYHVVTRGSCYCRVAGEAPVQLEAGDAVVIPHGDSYAMATAPELRGPHSPDEALGFFRELAAGRLPPVIVEGGGLGAGPLVLCGFLGCDRVPFNPVLAALPRVLKVAPPADAVEDRLRPLVELAVLETRERRPGSGCVLLRLSELLFVEVVRRHLESPQGNCADWLAGLRDPIVGRALSALHERPAHPWNLTELSRAAGLSRSSLAARFAAFVGMPPMQYLTRWRLQLAARLLADVEASDATVEAVAHRVGYESDAAFSRAFKRATGSAPARWRARARCAR